jgi:hypothetical protein
MNIKKEARKQKVLQVSKKKAGNTTPIDKIQSGIHCYKNLVP